MAEIGADEHDEPIDNLEFMSTMTERLKFCWPITDWSERTQRSIRTPRYTFLVKENVANMVQWRLEVFPNDKDVQGADVVSAALYLSTYHTEASSIDYKVLVTISIKDSQGGESHSQSSCVYYLAREGLPNTANPSYKVNICSREELMSHHLTLVPDNTLTFLVRMVFVQEQRSTSSGHQEFRDNFVDGSNSLSGDLGDAFKSSDFTDMTIVCDKREFHCHKFMLAARSEVFAAMLRHEFLEKQSSRVDVKEIDAETMSLLLNYIYTGRVSDFKSVSVVELFKAADRYRLDHLKHMCEEELVNRVEASNAADILSLAHKYNAAPLKSFALAMISRNVEQVMRTNGWKELILNDQGLLIEAFDSLARYNLELKTKLVDINSIVTNP